MIFAGGYYDARSCTTTTCFEDGVGPNRSTATDSQHLDGTWWCFIGCETFLSVNIWQLLQFWMKVLTFSSMLWKKKWLRSLLSKLDCPGWLPWWANSIAFSCKKVEEWSGHLWKGFCFVWLLFLVVCSNFRTWGSAVFGIHCFPLLISLVIFCSGLSFCVSVAISANPRWSMMGVVCIRYSRLLIICCILLVTR